MQKWMKWTLACLGALVIAGGITTYGSIAMASETESRPWMEFMPKIMQQRAAAHLESLVKEGKLTQAEADQLQALMKSEMESRMAKHAEGSDHEEGGMAAEINRLVEQGKLSPELAAKLKTVVPTMAKGGMHGPGKEGFGPMGHGPGFRGHGGGDRSNCPVDKASAENK